MLQAKKACLLYDTYGDTEGLLCHDWLSIFYECCESFLDHQVFVS